MDINLHAPAQKAVRKLDAKTLDRICVRLGDLAEGERADVQRVVGASGFRLRVGDWRILIDFEDGALNVLDIRHRREAYRR